MIRLKVSLATAIFFAVGSISFYSLQTASAADIVVGTAASATDHYNVGRAVCRQIQRSVKGVSCETLRMEGGDAAEPLAVLSDLQNAALELGIVPSDWQYHAVKNSGPLKFMDIKFDNLRSVLSLHAEPFTLIARRDSGIDGLDDLAGKRINVGKPGSPQRAAMEMVMKAKGWTRKSFQFADELSEAEQSLALCHNSVQAIVSTAAHPNAATAQALKLCDAKIIAVTGKAIDKLLADNPFLVVAEIPKDTYDGVMKPVKTIGATATLLSTSDMEDDLIHTVVQSVLGDLDRFKRMHPALGGVWPSGMMKGGRTAPLHNGALRYFREKGMM